MKLYVHEIVSSTQQPVGPDRLLLVQAAGTYPLETHTTSAPGAWEVSADNVALNAVQGVPVNSQGAQPASWSSKGGLSWVTAVDSAGDVAHVNDNGAVEMVTPAGVVHTYAVPDAKSGPLDAPGHVPPPVVGGGTGANPNALIFAPDGHLIVAAGNSANGEVADLTAGRRLDLLGYGWIEGMVFAPDGNLYIVAMGTAGGVTPPYTFLVVNYASLTLVSTLPTAYRPTGGTSFSIAVTGEAVYFYVTFPQNHGPTIKGGPRDHELFKMAPGSHFIQEVPITANGEQMQGMHGGHLVFYGGPVGNVVTTWDPSAGPMPRGSVTIQMAPVGSYITAVFEG